MLNYFPKYLARQSIILFILLLIISYIVFNKNILPIEWIISSLFVVILFFILLNKFTVSWKNLPQKTFINKLFITALILRVLWVVSSYFLFNYLNGDPFEFEAADSEMYHYTSSILAELGFSESSRVMWGLAITDRGYPIYLALIYIVFSDYVLIPRIINALLGSWMSILIYKLSRRNFGEATGRIAGILSVLLPNFIYYSGLHLKETVMVFLVIAFLERADYFLKKRITSGKIILLFILILPMFFFRNVLAYTLIISFFSALLFIPNKFNNWVNRVFISLWLGLIIWFLFASRIQVEINQLLDQRIAGQEQNMTFRSQREGGNSLARYGSTAVFAPIMLVVPFPTLVNIETQQTQMMLAGAYFIKNIYSFFVIIGLIVLYKRKLLRKHILLLSFILVYLLILAQSPFALSERFHLPVAPLLIILAAYGINNIDLKKMKWYIPYLILISLLILSWNWFKLAGRGT